MAWSAASARWQSLGWYGGLPSIPHRIEVHADLGGFVVIRARPGLDAHGRNLEWVKPCVAITACSGAIVTVLLWINGVRDIPSPTVFLFYSVLLGFIVGGTSIFIQVALALKRGSKPNLRAHATTALIVVLGAVLAGLDQHFFRLMKPTLDVYAPFWADRFLADLDLFVFGTDPWKFFVGWDLPTYTLFYTFAWYPIIAVSLVALFALPASRKKSAAILSWFALWSVFSPICELLLSSAGPIFYERIGLGDRFAALPVPPITALTADYLWMAHEQGALAIGAGIAAMPSLHVAASFWLFLVAWSYRHPILIVMSALFAAGTMLGSVALGWHYASDGLVGGAGAWACLYGSRIYFARHRPTAEPNSEPQTQTTV
jgi:hypothetical protein